jgi:hypothetical protein
VNLAIEGNMNRTNQESQNTRKPACTPRFLAKSITCSHQIIMIDQLLANSSRTTVVDGEEFDLVALALWARHGSLLRGARSPLFSV